MIETGSIPSVLPGLLPQLFLLLKCQILQLIWLRLWFILVNSGSLWSWRNDIDKVGSWWFFNGWHSGGKGGGQGTGKMRSVHSIKEIGKDLCPIFTQILIKGAVTTEAGISQFPLKRPALSSGGGSYLGIPWKGALLGCVEREGGKTSSDPHPIDPWISWMRQSGQPEIVVASRNAKRFLLWVY